MIEKRIFETMSSRWNQLQMHDHTSICTVWWYLRLRMRIVRIELTNSTTKHWMTNIWEGSEILLSASLVPLLWRLAA